MIIHELKDHPELVPFVIDIICNRWGYSKVAAAEQAECWMRNHNNSTCFVGVVDGKPMATGAFDPFSDVDETISPWNTLLWVEPEYRGKGYGNQLVQKRFEYARNLGYDTVYLDTADAMDYHLKFGWQIVKKTTYMGEYNTIMKYNIKTNGEGPAIIKIEKDHGRLRIKINGITHLSFPYQEENFNLIIQAYFVGKDNFYNIDYHMNGQIIETGYTRKDLFEGILGELEKHHII